MPRNTNTGGVLEAMILPALKRGHYTYQAQVKAGTRCGGGTHKVDALAEKDGAKVLVTFCLFQGLTLPDRPLQRIVQRAAED